MTTCSVNLPAALWTLQLRSTSPAVYLGLRVCLYGLSDRGSILDPPSVLTMAAITCDARSKSKLSRDLAACINSLYVQSAGLIPSMPAHSSTLRQKFWLRPRLRLLQTRALLGRSPCRSGCRSLRSALSAASLRCPSAPRSRLSRRWLRYGLRRFGGKNQLGRK